MSQMVFVKEMRVLMRFLSWEVSVFELLELNHAEWIGFVKGVVLNAEHQ
jgi:hypothetical protein